MWKFRLTCLAYCVVLTLLLLVPDPAALLGLRQVPGIGGGMGVHFMAFGLLGVLVAASRLPLPRRYLAGLLLLYAVGVELLQLLVPLRTFEMRDLLENLLGLLAGVTTWRVAAGHKNLSRSDPMPIKERFRLLTPEGLTTYDTFVLADEQPRTVVAGCLLLVHQPSGRLLTVHRTRLLPVENPGVPAGDRQPHSPCLTCGRVEGIVADQVVCPLEGQSSCGLIEAKT